MADDKGTQNQGVNNPHDRLFRETFAHVESLRSFVRAYAPAGVAALIDDDTSIEPWPGSFVDPGLSIVHSDIVYKFTVAGTPAFLYLLFEHQSTPDADMAFRLFKYLGRLWDDIDKKEPGTRPRPPVLPLVLYHGRHKWNAALQFQDLIAAPTALLPHTPGFEYLLVDLNEPEMRDRVVDLRCRFVLHLLHAGATDRLFEAFRRHGPLLRRLWATLAGRNDLAFFETIVRYALSVDSGLGQARLIQVISGSVNREAEEMVMSTAEKLIAEGEARGEVRGEIKILQHLLAQKFPDAPPVDLERFSPEQLEEIGRRILTCATQEEVLEGLR